MLALTTLSFTEAGEIYDVDVEVNTADHDIVLEPLPGQADLLSVCTHEAGHFFGLSHSTVPDATMNDRIPTRYEHALARSGRHLGDLHDLSAGSRCTRLRIDAHSAPRLFARMWRPANAKPGPFRGRRVLRDGPRGRRGDNAWLLLVTAVTLGLYRRRHRIARLQAADPVCERTQRFGDADEQVHGAEPNQHELRLESLPDENARTDREEH